LRQNGSATLPSCATDLLYLKGRPAVRAARRSNFLRGRSRLDSFTSICLALVVVYIACLVAFGAVDLFDDFI